MSENEGGSDSRFMTGFLVGFIVGVLICLGVGGTFAMIGVQRQRGEAAVMDAMQAAEEARFAAEVHRKQAEAARFQAQEAIRVQKAEEERKAKTAAQAGGKKEGEK